MRLARMRRGFLLAAAGVVLHAAPASAAAAPPNPTTVELGSSFIGAIAVDDANQHVFLSVPISGQIEVYDFNGNLVKTITGLPGADAMVVHGSTLYVGEDGDATLDSGAIVAVDLSTLSSDGAIASGMTSVGQLAFAGGELWTTTVVSGTASSQLTSVSLAGTVTNFENIPAVGVAASPGTPDDLYVTENSSLAKFDVSAGTPLQLSSQTGTYSGVAISPDGSRVIPVGGRDFTELSASTLETDGIVYGTQSAPLAAATSPANGGIIATALDWLGVAPEIFPYIDVFPLGSEVPIYELGTNPNLPPSGLAFSGDGTRLFELSGPDNGADFMFIWDLDPQATGTEIIASPSALVAGQDATLTATVAPADGGGSVSFEADGRPISGCDDEPLTVASVGGTATCITTALPYGADVTLTADYSGDSAHSSSSGSTTTLVQQPPGSDYTWTGGGTEDNISDQQWSDPSNWAQGVIPYGAVGSLSFSGVSCDGYSCGCSYGVCNASNDISGLAANALDIDSSTPYDISGDGLTLGAGGLTVEGEASGGTAPSTLDLPLTLGAPQSWTIDDADTPFDDAVSGDQPLRVAFSNGSSLVPSGGIEVGDLTASGEGGFYLNGSMAVNSTDSSVVNLENGGGIEADLSNNSVGPVTVDSDGWLSVGGIANGGSSLAVDGNLTFNDGSELDLSVASPGTEAGVDYSQLTATGNVNLSGATLYVSQGADDQDYCDNLNPGDTLTLLSATGLITGRFANYPQGASVDIANDCDTSTQDATGTISYSSNTVTLTITNGGNAGGNGGSGGTGANPPLEVDAPSLSGTAQEAQTLQVDPGTWEQESSFEYSWWACDADGNCTQIPNASSSSLQLTSAQLGDQIGAIVTADGPGGSNSDYTNLSDVVAAEPVPTISSAPVITGATSPGDVLSATNGSWSNSPTTYTYQWERCSASGTGCSAIPGATSQTYTLASADSGSTLEIQVTASNFGGKSSPASSSATGVVATEPAAIPAPSTTPAAITTALKSVLAPTGKTASFAAVISHHGYTFSFHAPAAGKLSVTWTATVKHKTITVAKGSANVTRPQALHVSVRLTRAGIAALKRHSRLKIRSVVSFTATGLQQVVAAKTFTLAGHTLTKKAPKTRSSPKKVTLQRIKMSFGAKSGRTRGPVRVRRSDFRQP
jgi:hypothetical protein